MINIKNKIPPPLVAVLFGAIMWGITSFSPVIELSVWVRWVMPTTLVLTGAFFCLAGVISFKKAKTTVNPLHPDKASSLVTSGIYQVTRNPMYLGFTLFLAAWCVYLSSILSITGVVTYMLYMQIFQIIPEENALIKIFGAEFEEYQSTVRRWL